MNQLDVDLSKQKYDAFDLSKNNIISLKSKNFIFGKNGAGKSTFTKILQEQFENTHDVRLFTGFENILEDSQLNAIVLGKENVTAQMEIRTIDTEITNLNFQIEKKRTILKKLRCKQILNSLDTTEDFGEEHELLVLKNTANNEYQNQESKIGYFLKAKAKELKELSNPQITKPTYTFNDFSNDIPFKKKLDSNLIFEYEKNLTEKTKEKIGTHSFPKIPFTDYIDTTNEILAYKIKEKITITEFENNQEKKQFASDGLKLHTHEDMCAFCGNEITTSRIETLKTYFSADDINYLNQSINKQFIKLDGARTLINNLKPIEEKNFYSKFIPEIKNINAKIINLKEQYLLFIFKLEQILENKSNNLFSPSKEVTFQYPENMIELEKNINQLIKNNNSFTSNLKIEQEVCKNKLRFHYVAVKLDETNKYRSDWKGYDEENLLLNTLKQLKLNSESNLQREIKSILGDKNSPKDDTFHYIINQINTLSTKKNALLKTSINTSILATHINSKLKKVGKQNLELILQKDENNIEHYQIKSNDIIRSIDKISTGEKNIIAFLYFLESLSDRNKSNNKPKIIIFDDPMNSNDDTMQYLIITELFALYRGELEYNEKFNPNKDYFICLTHNVHFYLNVQPHGSLPDSKGRTKYKKNNFYRIENKIFTHIENEKNDFNTHYQSLWIELKTLYEQNLLNSMLNSMRRIIETYTHFNNIDTINFYNDNEIQKKLFNVNSHAIDDHSAEMIASTKEDLIFNFKAVFDNNNAVAHFNAHWL